MTPWSGAADAATESGARVVLGGRYEILGLLGSGGMGSVYRAFDRVLEEVVALKTLRKDVPLSERLLERFRREAKLARRVTHPNVARTFDIGEDGEERFLTMEYVEGEPLAALLAREGRLAPARVTPIALAVCAGLEAAHAVNVVHRDLKPENVLLERTGRVVITDFGIACAKSDPDADRRTLGVVGTPAYMSPEQVEGSESVDARSDIYALGVMLFELLTGRLPFVGNTPYAVASARLTHAPPDPRRERGDIPDAIARVILRCMARSPTDRYASAAAVAAELAATAPTQIDEFGTSRSSADFRAPDPLRETRAGEKTVAVLPFRNAGPAEDEYLADGLTEDLVDTLSMLEGLRVRPRASVQKYARELTDPREIGRALGVEVVVEGSVRPMGEALRIAARLIGVGDGYQLWAKRFDRPRKDALVVSDEAAEAIATALSASERPKLRAAPSDANAIDHYLRGKAELRRIWREPMRRAAELFAEAHRLAPDDPSFLAALARARARLWYFDGGATEGKEVRELADQALARAPERGESWLALASVHFVEQDLGRATELLREALERAPQLAEAHELLAEISLEVCTPERALERYRAALALDPALRCRFHMARAHAYRGHWHEVDLLEQIPPEDEQTASMRVASQVRLALWSGEATARTGSLVVPESVEDLLPVRYAEIGLSAIHRGALSDLGRTFIESQLAAREQAPRFVIFKHMLVTELGCFVGELELALRHLDAAVQSGLGDRNWLELCPVLAPIRERPEFEDLAGIVSERAARVRI